jgi:hypothetical protein
MKEADLGNMFEQASKNEIFILLGCKVALIGA